MEPEVETAGLDVSEHGMWGYPEFYIPVPGGYDNWVTPPWDRHPDSPHHPSKRHPRPTLEPAPEPG